MACGIYKIENLISGYCYIGQSINIEERIKRHKYSLNKNKHANIHLQNAWNKYGSANFTFKIILLCERYELSYYEQSFVDRTTKLYNILTICVDSPKGTHLSVTTKRKIKKYWKERQYNTYLSKIYS